MLEHARFMSEGARTIFWMRRTKYTRELLEPLVASSTSYSDVIRKLGLEPNGGMHRHISGRIRHAGLDTSHFGGKLRVRVEAIAERDLVEVARTALSMAHVLTHFDLPTVGRAHHELKRRLRDLAIDTSHFRGQGWSRGETEKTHPTVASNAEKLRLPDDEVFIENSPYLGGGQLMVKRLLAQGWTYQCRECAISEWCGKPLVLHLDHINGIHNDNRLDNLRLLCPNCHSQTETYCNKTRPTRASEPRVRYSCYTEATRACRNW